MFASAVTGIFAAAYLFVCPGNVPAATAIDETMPDTIPSQIVQDWIAQDGNNYAAIMARIRDSLPEAYRSKISGEANEATYRNACHWRRVMRIKPFAERIGKILYARHHDIGGTTVGYIEDLDPDGSRGLGQWGVSALSKSSDYAGGNTGGTALLLLDFRDYYPQPTVVVADSFGGLRDPCVSYDGKIAVYAHSKDNDGYHICETTIATGATRQLTDDPAGLRVSDFQPCILPSGDIIFNSSRCFSSVSHNLQIASNLYLMQKDGKYLRRIGYDQAHTFYPTTMEDGNVLYSRIEFNGRNVSNCSGIFTMNSDGTHQAGLFGTQTSRPAAYLQCRQIPGTRKVMAVIGGHLGPYAGDLAIIDPVKARDGEDAVRLVAPLRNGFVGPVYSMEGVPDEDKLFQDPLPLDERWFVASYRKTRSGRFQIYLMDIYGNRELIATGGSQSVSQPQACTPRSYPAAAPFPQADYSRSTAEMLVENVYTGSGVDTVVAKGSIEKLRVIALEYRTDPAFGSTGTASQFMTPIGRFGSSLDTKRIVGEAQIASDGSTAFVVPARTPLYFQLIDTAGRAAQTMRSWVTLQPGERYKCRGCHVDEAHLPAASVQPLAQTAVPLTPFFGSTEEPFYFPKHIQPILDVNCVKSGCHDSTHAKLVLTGKKFWTNDLSDVDNNNAFRYWTLSYYYLSDTKKHVNCNAIFGSAEGIQPYSTGSGKSALVTRLLSGHKNVSLTKADAGKIFAWIDLGIPHAGRYTDDMRPGDSINYELRFDRRRKMEKIEAENIAAFVAAGGYHGTDYIGTNIISREPGSTPTKALNKNSRLLSVKYSRANRTITAILPTDGMMTLLDMAGRIVVNRIVQNNQASVTSGTISIPARFPAGVYVIRYKGGDGAAEQITVPVW